MNAYGYFEELEDESSPTPQPVTKSTPVTESDKARAWLAAIDLDSLPVDGDPIHGEFFKYSVSVYRGKLGFYLTTRSPQQKTWRRSMGTCWARVAASDEVSKGLERFISDREAVQGRHIARRDAKRQARAEFENPYKVGDFLYSSWGYDQTNREFYQVLEVRPTALLIQEVAQNRERTGYDSGTCSPIRDRFVKPAQWVTLQIDGLGGHSVPSPIHGGLYTYEGKPVYFSDGH